MNCDQGIFWRDSEVTLGHIRNESKKSKVFVANRIELIREHSKAEEWHCFNTKRNPADYVSKGISMGNGDKAERWILGLKFLWEPEDTWNTKTKTPAINPEDPELKKVVHVNQMFCKQTFYQFWKIMLHLGQNGQNCSTGDTVYKDIKE